MNNFDMIIFDMDGTLWDTTDITFEASNIIAQEYDEVKEVNIDLIKSIMGLSLENVARKMMPYLSLDKAIYYVKLRIDKTNELLNEKGGSTYYGVISTIKKLSKNHKLGIITNNFDEYAKVFITSNNLEDCFTDYIGTATYNITKTEAIRRMVERNNIKTACYVGDINKDMEAAIDAQTTFIHAKYGFDPSLRSDLYIDNFSELGDMLED